MTTSFADASQGRGPANRILTLTGLFWAFSYVLLSIRGAIYHDDWTKLIDDNRLLAVNGSAADVRQIIADCGFEHADYILSGLPFSTLPTGIGPKIAEATAEALRPGGAFLVYQFSPKVKDFLDPHFKRIDHDMEWWNVPPAQLYWAWKD